MDNQRYDEGFKMLKQVLGDKGEAVTEKLKDVAPDLGKYAIEFAFGDIFCRKGLDLKSREIAIIAGLTALGNASPQLKLHIEGALNVGCSRKEIIEVMIQMAVFAGFPAALNGVFAAKEVFNQLDK